MPDSPGLDVRRAVRFANGTIVEVRCHLQSGAVIVVEEALARFQREHGSHLTLGAMLEMLSADYIAGP